MKNISIVQIIILIILSVLMFSDFSGVRKKLTNIANAIISKNRKKGS